MDEKPKQTATDQAIPLVSSVPDTDLMEVKSDSLFTLGEREYFSRIHEGHGSLSDRVEGSKQVDEAEQSASERK